MKNTEVHHEKLSFLPNYPRTKEGVEVIRSVEGFVLFIRNLHPETTEDSIVDVIEEISRVTNICLGLDKQSGFAKGYALLEFQDFAESENVMKAHRREPFEILGKVIEMDYAFVSEDNTDKNNHKDCKNHENRGQRDKSPSRN